MICASYQIFLVGGHEVGDLDRGSSLFVTVGLKMKPEMKHCATVFRMFFTDDHMDLIVRETNTYAEQKIRTTSNTPFRSRTQNWKPVSRDSTATYKGPSKRFKTYLVLYHLNKKFQSLYLPRQNIAIDESMMLWRGRLSFKQYMPLKASKFGIKSYELCESSSGYLWSFIIYMGKDTVCSVLRQNTHTTDTTGGTRRKRLSGRDQ